MIDLRVGDCREILATLPEQSVQCCITSPPYFGLRDYGIVGQVGMEPTPEEYVQALVGVFRAVWRVLRDDGTLWLNLGDTYAANRGYQVPDNKHTNVGNHMPMTVPTGLKPKDLIGTPWRMALALQADGWYLRSDIIWAKPNPMPESVTDRPTRAHEYLFLLTKRESYYYDHLAVLEPFADARMGRDGGKGTSIRNRGGRTDGFTKPNNIDPSANGGRNRRSVWFIPTKPFKGAHFATFPPKLVEPCLLAGTSAHGSCSHCGAPYKRVVEREAPPAVAPAEIDRFGTGEAGVHRKVGQQYQNWLDDHPNHTVGWQATCSCSPATVIPCLVLDPFCGSGTVGVVARQQGRDFLGLDLNPEYIALARQRLDTEGLLEPEVRAACITETPEAAGPEAAPEINAWLTSLMQQVSR